MAEPEDELPFAEVLYCGGRRWSSSYFKNRGKPKAAITLDLGKEILGKRLHTVGMPKTYFDLPTLASRRHKKHDELSYAFSGSPT